MQPAGRVDQHDVHGPGFGSRQPVKHHGRRVRSLPVLDHVGPDSFAPYFQLFDGRGPEGIRRHKERGQPLLAQATGQFRHTRGFPHAVDAHRQNHEGVGTRSDEFVNRLRFHGRQDVRHRPFQLLNGFPGIASRRGPKPFEQTIRRANPDVRSQQRRFDFLQHLGVEAASHQVPQ